LNSHNESILFVHCFSLYVFLHTYVSFFIFTLILIKFNDRISLWEVWPGRPSWNSWYSPANNVKGTATRYCKTPSLQSLLEEMFLLISTKFGDLEVITVFIKVTKSFFNRVMSGPDFQFLFPKFFCAFLALSGFSSLWFTIFFLPESPEILDFSRTYNCSFCLSSRPA